ALGWLEERAKLPFADDRARLAHCLARARARFHGADEAGAAAEADRCLELAGDGKFRPLALDRAGLYHLVAGDVELAAARYEALWPLVEKASGAEAGRNRLTTQIGWAAALLALGRAQDALPHIAAAEKISAPAPLAGPFGRSLAPTGAIDYRLLLAGLRAQAHFGAGQLAEAAAAMKVRCDGLAAPVAREPLDADRLSLAACEGQLGRYAYLRHAPDEALAHVEAALGQWDAWSESTATPVEDTGLALLAAYAELHVFAGLPLARLRLDLPRRLDA